MSWTYSGNPNNNKIDEVRYLIGDTDKEFPILTDQEIEFSLVQTSYNSRRSAIMCIDLIIARLVQDGDYTVGNVKIDNSSTIRNYKTLQSNLKSNLSTSGVPTFVRNTCKSLFSNEDR